jgi:hypothetical protein
MARLRALDTIGRYDLSHSPARCVDPVSLAIPVRRRSRRGSPRTIAPTGSKVARLPRIQPWYASVQGDSGGSDNPAPRCRRKAPAGPDPPNAPRQHARSSSYATHSTQTPAAIGKAEITRPGPRRRLLHHSWSDRVLVHVSGYRPKVGLFPPGPSHSLRGRGDRHVDHAAACP